LQFIRYLAVVRRKRNSRKTKYESLEERLPHKLWQSLQKMARTRYGLRIIALRVEEEGTFLVHVKGLTTKGGSDDKVANGYN
jgi:DNA repair exonuclease SbcCD ATPase subunit